MECIHDSGTYISLFYILQSVFISLSEFLYLAVKELSYRYKYLFNLIGDWMTFQIYESNGKQISNLLQKKIQIEHDAYDHFVPS